MKISLDSLGFNSNNKFSFRSFAIVSTLAALFSWFVLKHADATLFFGVCAGISVLLVASKNNITSMIDGVHDELNDERKSRDTEMEHIHRNIDRIEDRLTERVERICERLDELDTTRSRR